MSSDKPVLRVDWATYEAAKYACEHWHYSKSVPAGKIVKVGVWEDERYIGVVLFSRGSNKHIGTPFNLTQLQAVELVRVALTSHKSFVSQVLKKAINYLKSQSPGLRLIISFADPNEGHHGGIYQATNWVYSGYGSEDKRCRPYIKNGITYHWRTVAETLSKLNMRSTVDDAIKNGFIPKDQKPKHRYLFPLDKAMKKQISPLAKPYPKREVKPDA